MAARARESVDFIVDEKGTAVDMRKTSALSVKVNIDVSEALTGLKAVQREAKKVAQAMRELESGVNDISDSYLSDEKEALSKLVSYGIHKPIAKDCIASRNPHDLKVVIEFLDRYGKYIN